MSENDTAIIGSKKLIKERFDQILESLKEIKSDLKKMDEYLRG